MAALERAEIDKTPLHTEVSQDIALDGVNEGEIEVRRGSQSTSTVDPGTGKSSLDAVLESMRSI